MRTPARILPFALLCALASPGGAQGTIRGVLFDSLRAGAPVANAEVVIIGTDRRTSTDRRGRFTFEAVPAGPHRVAYWAPWLDSVALPAIEHLVSVVDAAEAGVVDAPTAGMLDAANAGVALATPSMGTLQRSLCGAVLEPGQGILFGDVREPDGTPLVNVPVWARWMETTLGVGQLDRRDVATIDTTSASGFFALCGVPRDAEIALRAKRGDRLGTGELVAALGGEPLRRRDLVASAPDMRIRLTGRIHERDDSPIEGAVVVALDDSLRQVTSDADGRFAFDAFPRRSTQLVVKAVGYRPATVEVDPTAGGVAAASVTLESVPYELTRVRVDGRVMSPEEFEFERRRSVNTGYFVDEDEIKRYPTFSPAALYSLAPRSRLHCPSECVFMLTRAIDWCMPKLFVDGFVVDSTEQKQWLQRAKRVEVYRAAFAPPQFTDFKGCGALVIWTR